MKDEKENKADNKIKDFQFPGNIVENISEAEIKQYKRDFMLQLRLHPLSLQKPKNIPDMDVVKQKLYLHDINDFASTDNTDMNNLYSLTKNDYYNLKNGYMVSPYINRMFPYCYPSNMYGNAYSNVQPSKYRLPLHTYCNPLKKASSYTSYKDFGIEECLWAKRCFTPTEDIWNFYPAHVHANYTKKREDLEYVPKCKKKLSIIDPETGKNILENIMETSNDQQISDYSINSSLETQDANSELKNFHIENRYEDCLCEVNQGLQTAEEIYNNHMSSSLLEDKIYSDSMKDNILSDTNFSNNKLPEDAKTLPICNSAIKSPSMDGEKNLLQSKDGIKKSKISTSGENEMLSYIPKVHENCETNKESNEQTPTEFLSKEANFLSDLHVNYQSQHVKEYNPLNYKENSPKQNSSVNDSLKQLREKIYILRQEQQKMAILQSFLRYKKYQLEESARSLDEKRIEIANWECNLHNKAKKLQDKEHWLENKSEILYSKAQHVATREKLFNNEDAPSRNLPRVNCPNKKFIFDNCNDISWEDACSKVGSTIKSKETGDNDYAYFKHYSSKSTANSSGENVAHCKSVMSSLDELEKNIVKIEGMQISEKIDNSQDNKSDYMYSFSFYPNEKCTTRTSGAV